MKTRDIRLVCLYINCDKGLNDTRTFFNEKTNLFVDYVMCDDPAHVLEGRLLIRLVIL